MPRSSASSRTVALLLGAFAVLLVIAIISLVLLLRQSKQAVTDDNLPVISSEPRPTALPTFASQQSLVVPALKSNEIIYGSAAAPVLMYEYSDLECPFCRDFHQTTLSALTGRYGDRLGVVYRYFPLPTLHPSAPMEAKVVACVAQKSTTTARNLVNLNYQRTSASGASFTQDQYLDLAAEVGANRSQTADCLQKDQSNDQVQADIDAGKSLGAHATPTFFLVRPSDGYTVKVEGAYGADDFRQLINYLMPA